MHTESQFRNWKTYVYCENCAYCGKTSVTTEKGLCRAEPACDHPSNFKLVRFWKFSRRVYFNHPRDINSDGYCCNYKEEEK
jgi:hypothetical protein